jgi:4-amino-4-deoxy-L-arabinose transferase-like glycosyltransferase
MKLSIIKNKSLFLPLIIIIAAILRFSQLGSNPPSLTWDETAWGYNAYSLGIDGRDEFGRFLPYDYLESFGDFKPPIYAYLDIIPVKLFGLNEFAVRFPSALFGTLTVLMTYFLTKRIFERPTTLSLRGEQRRSNLVGDRHAPYQSLAMTATALLAISPWHILLSRAAFEANVATFFIVFGVYAFLRGIQDKSKFLILSAVSFALSLYTFNTSRVFVPLLIIALAVLYHKKLLQMKRLTISAAIIGLVIILPSVHFLLSPQARLRYQEVNIFSDVGLVRTANQEVENDHNVWWSKIIHNRRIFYAREYAKHYFDNLSFNFLFIQGDGNSKFSTRDIGQMYLWELPFLLVGVLMLFRLREKNWFIIPIWLILGIIPAATARETPHALRIETTLPTFQILVAYGIINTLTHIKKYQRIFLGILSLIIGLSFIYFLHVYFLLYPWEFSGDWQYGYKDSIAYVKSVQKDYDHIVITNSLGRPYIYYLFYLNVAPSEFRKSAIIKRDVFGFVDVEGFSKYRFPKMTQAIPDKGRTLYVTSSEESLPSGIKPLKIFYKLDGTPTLQAFTL